MCTIIYHLMDLFIGYDNYVYTQILYQNIPITSMLISIEVSKNNHCF